MNTLTETETHLQSLREICFLMLLSTWTRLNPFCLALVANCSGKTYGLRHAVFEVKVRVSSWAPSLSSSWSSGLTPSLFKSHSCRVLHTLVAILNILKHSSFWSFWMMPLPCTGFTNAPFCSILFHSVPFCSTSQARFWSPVSDQMAETPGCSRAAQHVVILLDYDQHSAHRICTA